MKLHGIIKRSENSTYHNLVLVSPSGKKTNLISAFVDWIENNGAEMTVRYWFTDKPVTFKEATKTLTRSVSSSKTEAGCIRHYDEYNDYTSYTGVIKLGKHDLYTEFDHRVGQHVWIELNEYDTPEDNAAIWATCGSCGTRLPARKVEEPLFNSKEYTDQPYLCRVTHGEDSEGEEMYDWLCSTCYNEPFTCVEFCA